MEIYGRDGLYKGDFNDKNEPHGIGFWTCNDGSYEGTFRQGKLDGYCYAHYSNWGNVTVGEMKEGKWHGHATSTYHRDEDVHCNEEYCADGDKLYRDLEPTEYKFDIYNRQFRIDRSDKGYDAV